MQSAATYSASNPTVIPDGGLATFLTATEGRWAQDNPWAGEYDDIGPSQGIGSVKQVADKIAEFGRNEDTYIVHAAHGETVIPMEVLDADPRLKARLFSQMKGMGIEPERYIVGSELNSINPVTGQPEFFLKKLASSVWKGIKKVFRTAAQIVLPIVGGMMLGPVGAFVGSYAGTLIAGGNSAQALKAAKVAGITQGISQVGSAALQAAGTASQAGAAAGTPLTLGQKLSAGLSGGISSLGQGLGLAEGTSFLDQFRGGIGGLTDPEKYLTLAKEGAPTLGERFQASKLGGSPLGPLPEFQTTGAQKRLLPQETRYGDPTSGQFGPLEVGPADMGMYSEGTMYKNFGPDGKLISEAPDLFAAPQQTTAEGATRQGMAGQRNVATSAAVDPNKTAFDAMQAKKSATFLERLKGPDGSYFDMESLGNLKDMILGGRDLNTTRANMNKAADYLAAKDNISTVEALAKIKKNYTPGLLQKWGPAAIVALGLSATQEAEQPEMPQITTGFDLYAQNPGMYGIQQPNFNAYGASFAPPQGQGTMAGMTPAFVAGGGGMTADFPRRDGPIYGPGTETSDDIPAMLSDGEFVMTARAVRGAGGGDRERGMQRMYNIMNAFEGGAV